MIELSSIFSVELYAYAILDNHYQLVLYIDPLAPQKWTDEQIAEKWLLAYPGKLDASDKRALRESKKKSFMADKDKLAKYRERFGQLSCFMSRLNEPLAKTSNQEDFVNGRFWDHFLRPAPTVGALGENGIHYVHVNKSRYTSIALLDETAVLSCMAYVDLNPIRAGIVEELRDSLYTSIQ